MNFKTIRGFMAVRGFVTGAILVALILGADSKVASAQFDEDEVPEYGDEYVAFLIPQPKPSPQPPAQPPEETVVPIEIDWPNGDKEVIVDEGSIIIHPDGSFEVEPQPAGIDIPTPAEDSAP